MRYNQLTMNVKAPRERFVVRLVKKKKESLERTVEKKEEGRGKENKGEKDRKRGDNGRRGKLDNT